jgi:hypothetical protein
MSNRRLFILVEGNDDQRFFSRIIKPLLAPRYASVELVMYACMKRTRICKFINTIRAMGHEFILVADNDLEPSIRVKKGVIQERICAVDPGEIMVIVQEIESWYLAGIDRESARVLGIKPPQFTDQVTKERFNRHIPKRYSSRIAYMLDLLSYYSIPVAISKNRSFHYFLVHYHLEETGFPGSPQDAVQVQDSGPAIQQSSTGVQSHKGEPDQAEPAYRQSG